MVKKKLNEIPPDIRKLSFEEALNELEEIVQQLESGNIGLEESISTYSRGNMLKMHCQNKLAAAREKVEQIDIASDGNIGIKPLDQN